VTAPLQYGTQPASDPTAVMGRRTLAWISDLLLYGAVVVAGFASMAEYVDIPPGIAEAEACEIFQDQNPDAADACLAFDGQIFILDASGAGTQTLLSLGWFAFFVVLQGLTGGSPGKLLFGLRVVDQHGRRCGIGKSLGRTLLWVVDSAPWVVPLVGPITAFTSSGHRRVGDLAAGTYVVSASSAGSPIVPSGAAAPAGQPAWGAPPPGWGSAPPATPPASTTAQPPSMLSGPPEGTSGERWSSPIAPPEPDLDIQDLGAPDATEAADEAPPTVEADPDWARPPESAGAEAGVAPEMPEWSAPTLPEVEDPSADWEPPSDPGPSPFVAPGAEPSPPPPEAGSAGGGTMPGPEASPPAYELPPPQWDPARGTYLQWDPNRQAWLQWDAAGECWKPIDT
jgi:hypothetical protein